MKTIILMLLSFSIISCGTRNTETEKHETKFNENIETTKSGESNLKIDRNFESTEKQISGKMQLSIVSNSEASNPCDNQRKVIVKDSQGNSAEMTLNANEDINFGTESSMSEKWQNYAEALSEYTLAKENYKQSVERYEALKSKKTESDKSNTWLFAISLVFAYIVGMITLPLIRLFIESKLKIRV